MRDDRAVPVARNGAVERASLAAPAAETDGGAISDGVASVLIGTMLAIALALIGFAAFAPPVVFSGRVLSGVLADRRGDVGAAGFAILVCVAAAALIGLAID